MAKAMDRMIPASELPPSKTELHTKVTIFSANNDDFDEGWILHFDGKYLQVNSLLSRHSCIQATTSSAPTRALVCPSNDEDGTFNLDN